MKQFASAVKLIAVAAVLVIASLVVAGCGGDDNGGGKTSSTDSSGNKQYAPAEGLGESKKTVVESDDSFDEQQQQVVETITAFGDATAAKDYKALCALLSDEAQQIGGDCVKTFEKTGTAISDFKLTIKSVTVEKDGKTAKAAVDVTSNQNPKAQQQDIALLKDGDEWKIQILGQ